MLTIRNAYLLGWDLWMHEDLDEVTCDKSVGSVLNWSEVGWTRIAASGHFLGWRRLENRETRSVPPFWQDKVDGVWTTGASGFGYVAKRLFVRLSMERSVDWRALRRSESYRDRVDELFDHLCPAVEQLRRVELSEGHSPRFASLLYLEPSWSANRPMTVDSAIRATDEQLQFSASPYRARLIGDLLLAGSLGSQGIDEAATAVYVPNVDSANIEADRDPVLRNDKTNIVFAAALVERAWDYLLYSLVSRDLRRRAERLPLAATTVREHLKSFAPGEFSAYAEKFLPKRAKEMQERAAISASLRSVRKAISENLLHRIATDRATKWRTKSIDPPTDRSDVVSYAGLSDGLETLVASVDSQCNESEQIIQRSEDIERLLGDYLRDSTTASAANTNLVMQETSLALQRSVGRLTFFATLIAVFQLGVIFSPFISTYAQRCDASSDTSTLCALAGTWTRMADASRLGEEGLSTGKPFDEGIL